MFENLEKNSEMLIGAYKKTKSYYHYNKNFVFMKRKIAELEYENDKMDATIFRLAELLANPEKTEHKNIVDKWISEISFYVMPKAFADSDEQNTLFVTTTEKENKAVKKVNFFIDMPIELHLLDTLWTVLIGKLIYEKGIIGPESYGNSIDNYVVYNLQSDFLSSINFSKNKLFKVYFPQYCSWRNDAIKTIKRANNSNKSQMMFSLDIKGFYYSVLWKFSILDSIFGGDERYQQMSALTDIMEKIFAKYTRIISEYRVIHQNIEEKEYVLPIGMFCSMLLSNVYLSEFDKQVKSSQSVLHYGRYVDDIIIVADVTGDENEITDKTAFDKCLVKEAGVLEEAEAGKYAIKNLPTLLIQREKVKMIYFKRGEAKTLIDRLEKTITYPSQMNVVPYTEVKLDDFEEAVYAKSNISSETKIRDLGNLEIDRFELGRHMSQIVLNNRVRKSYVSKDEIIIRQNEETNILNFFVGSKALEYSSNWINALYYFFLTTNINQPAWKKFETNIREAIAKISINQIEDLRKGKSREVKSRMKKSLEMHFDICVAVVLALKPLFSRREKKFICELVLKLRRANLFNHSLVSFPLINYDDNIDDYCDLTNISPQMIHDMHVQIRNSRKSKFSPRFINLEEIFQFTFLVQSTKGGNYYLDSEKMSAQEKIRYIETYFYNVNQIYEEKAGHIAINISNNKNNGYNIQKICLGDNNSGKSDIKVAIANIKLDTKRCCLGLECASDVILNRLDLIRFMDRAFGEGKDKVDFLIFPEFYMPLQWLSDVLTFVRRSGITVISGVQYITCDRKAHNNIALFVPVKTGKYNNALMLVREKNDYAPAEKELLAVEKYRCDNQEIPTYQIIENEGIAYGLFLCYELTDIIARSLYKHRVDILFVPEHNRDTTYFSNIIETTARDLHVFIAQANTSIYGDSRITGPYRKNYRNVLQIKGGDSDDIIIGTLKVGKLRKYQDSEKVEFDKKIKEYLGLDKKRKFEKEKELFKEQNPEFARTSARFSKHR